MRRRGPFARRAGRACAARTQSSHARVFSWCEENAARKRFLGPTVRGARLFRQGARMCRAPARKSATVHPDWQAELPPSPRVRPCEACKTLALGCSRPQNFLLFDSRPLCMPKAHASGAFVHSAIQPPNESGSIFLSSSRRVLSTCRSESNEPTRRANCSQWGMSTDRITRLMSGI